MVDTKGYYPCNIYANDLTLGEEVLFPIIPQVADTINVNGVEYEVLQVVFFVDNGVAVIDLFVVED